MGDVLYNSISNYQRVSVLHNHIYIVYIDSDWWYTYPSEKIYESQVE